VPIHDSARTCALKRGWNGWVYAKTFLDDRKEVEEGLSGIRIDLPGIVECAADFLGKVL